MSHYLSCHFERLETLLKDNPGQALLDHVKALQDLLREAYPIIRGRHSRFTYGPRDLVERIQDALAACQKE